jgi:hypothetical protein
MVPVFLKATHKRKSFGYYSWTDPRMRNPRNYSIPQEKYRGAHVQKLSPLATDLKKWSVTQMSSSPSSQDFTIFTKSSDKKRGIVRISRILLRFDLYSCLHDQHDKDSLRTNNLCIWLFIMLYGISKRGVKSAIIHLKLFLL